MAKTKITDIVRSNYMNEVKTMLENGGEEVLLVKSGTFSIPWVKDEEEGYIKTEDIKKYGLIPEFIGRLPVVYTMEGLTKEMLVKILKEPKNALLKQYKYLLELDDVELEFEDDAVREIAKKAIKLGTGARALRTILENLMLDLQYEVPGKASEIAKVTVTKEMVAGSGKALITPKKEAV